MQVEADSSAAPAAQPPLRPDDLHHLLKVTSSRSFPPSHECPITHFLAAHLRRVARSHRRFDWTWPRLPRHGLDVERERQQVTV